jgi:hypothetical protein
VHEFNPAGLKRPALPFTANLVPSIGISSKPLIYHGFLNSSLKFLGNGARRLRQVCHRQVTLLTAGFGPGRLRHPNTPSIQGLRDGLPDVLILGLVSSL